MSSYLEIFANNLKFLRKFHNMKQEELSQETEIPRSNLSNYESAKNEVMLSTLIKISNVFNISIDVLISIKLNDDIYLQKRYKTQKVKSLTNFANNLKRLRQEKDMFQVELANELGMSKSSISVYEADKSDITLSALLKIINYFNVSIEELVSFRDIDPMKFTQEEIKFFQKVDIDLNLIETEKEFLKLLNNLKKYYLRQYDKLKNLVDNEIPNKIKEIDELINFVKKKHNDEN